MYLVRALKLSGPFAADCGPPPTCFFGGRSTIGGKTSEVTRSRLEEEGMRIAKQKKKEKEKIER